MLVIFPLLYQICLVLEYFPPIALSASTMWSASKDPKTIKGRVCPLLLDPHVKVSCRVWTPVLTSMSPCAQLPLQAASPCTQFPFQSASPCLIAPIFSLSPRFSWVFLKSGISLLGWPGRSRGWGIWFLSIFPVTALKYNQGRGGTFGELLYGREHVSLFDKLIGHLDCHKSTDWNLLSLRILMAFIPSKLMRCPFDVLFRTGPLGLPPP